MAIKRRLHAMRHAESATPSGEKTFSLTPSHHAAVYSHKTVPVSWRKPNPKHRIFSESKREGEPSGAFKHEPGGR